MHARYHWWWARLWSELGVAFDWEWAIRRGGAHIDAWALLVQDELNLRVLDVIKRPTVCR